MKCFVRIALVLVFVLAIKSLFSQSTQNGRVLEYNGQKEKTPVSLAEIITKGASPTTSDNNGRFKLNFIRLKPGDKIVDPIINKAGYIIFNKEALEQWRISSNNDDFIIILCDKNQFDELFQKYHQIGSVSYRKEYENAIADINYLLQEKQLTKDEYNTKYEKLLGEYQQSLKMLNKYVDYFARIDESNLNDLQSKALSFIKSGKIDDAIQLYEDSRLMQEYEKASNKISVGQTLIEEGMSDMRILESNITTYINACKLKGGAENYSKAGNALKQMTLIAPNNYEKVINYAQFALDQRNYVEAEIFYNKALLMQPDLIQRVEVLNKLGKISKDNSQYKKSKEYLLKAIELDKTIPIERKDLKYEISPDILITLGELYYVSNESEIGIQTFSDLISILSTANFKSENNTNIKVKLVKAYRGRGLIKSSIKEYEVAEQDLLEALSLTQELVKVDSNRFVALHANVLNCLGIVYNNINKLEEAEMFYLEAIRIRKKQTVANPKAYAYELTKPMVNMNSLLYKAKRYKEAEPLMKSQLIENRRLFRENPSAFYPTYLIAINTLCNLYAITDCYEEATHMIYERIECFNKIDSLNIKDYKGDVAWSYYLLSYYYKKNRQFDLSINACTKAIDLFLLLRDPEKILKCYSNLAFIYMEMESYKNALSVIEIIDNFREDELFAEHFRKKGLLYDYLKVLFYFADGQTKQSKAILYSLLQDKSKNKTGILSNNSLIDFLILIKLEEKDHSDINTLFKQKRKNLQKYKDKKDVSYKKKLAGYYESYGRYSLNLNFYSAAAYRYQKAANLYREVKKDEQKEYSSNLAYSLYNLGHTYTLQKKYQVSVDTLKLALTELKKAEKQDFSHSSEVAKLFSAIGFSLNKMGNYEEAEKYYLSSVKHYKLVDSLSVKTYSKELAEVLSDLGDNNYLLTKQKSQPDSSKYYYQESLSYYLKLPPEELTLNNHKLAYLYNDLALTSDSSEKQMYFNKSIECVRQELRTDSSVTNLGFLGTVLFLSGNAYFTSNQYNNADSLLLQANDIFIAINEKVVEQCINDMLSTIRMKQKRYNEALVYSVKSLQLYADSIYDAAVEDSVLMKMIAENDSIISNVALSGRHAVEVYGKLSSIFEKLNHKDKAIAYCELVLSNLNTKQPLTNQLKLEKIELNHKLAEYYYQKEDYDIAKGYFEACFNIKADENVSVDVVQSASDSYYLGNCCLNLGKYEKALSYFSQAINNYNNLNARTKKQYLGELMQVQVFYADVLVIKKDYLEARKGYNKALLYYIKENKRSSDTNLLWMIGDIYGRLSNCSESNVEKLRFLKKEINEREKVFEAYQNEITTPVIIQNYGNLSWYYLIEREYLKSEESVRRAIEIAQQNQVEVSRYNWIYTNLAHSLLLQGQFEDAKKIYMDIKDLSYPYGTGESFTEIFLQDFKALELAGITHPDIKRIKDLLND